MMSPHQNNKKITTSLDSGKQSTYISYYRKPVNLWTGKYPFN